MIKDYLLSGFLSINVEEMWFHQDGYDRKNGLEYCVIFRLVAALIFPKLYSNTKWHNCVY